jgi:hypothetical protein
MVLFAHLQARRTPWEVYFVLGGFQFYNYSGISVGIRRRMIVLCFLYVKFVSKNAEFYADFNFGDVGYKKKHF